MKFQIALATGYKLVRVDDEGQVSNLTLQDLRVYVVPPDSAALVFADLDEARRVLELLQQSYDKMREADVHRMGGTSRRFSPRSNR